MLINLQPSALKSQGLAAALQSLADKIKSTYSQNAIITMEENIHHLLTEDHAGRLHHTSGICIP